MADVYNLLGFQLRKKRRHERGRTPFYARPLEFDPDHKGALEIGELYVEMASCRRPAKMSRPAEAVPAGCEKSSRTRRLGRAAKAPVTQ